MKKLLAIVSIVLALISSGKIDIYPQTAMITDISDDLVTVETSTGNMFSFSGAEDYEVGDMVSMIMYGNYTDLVYDDEIIEVRYAGFFE